MGWTSTGGPKGLGSATNSPSTVADFDKMIKLIAERGNYLGPLTEAERDAVTGDALYEGLMVYNTTTDTLELQDGSGWLPIRLSPLLGEWHKNIAPGSPGGQAMGPSSATFAIAAAPYDRAIRVTIQGGVLPSSTGDGGVTVVPSTGSWAGGTNTHRVNAASASYFTPYSYVFYMATLPANTALTLTLNSISTTTCGYDMHFIVEGL